MDICKSAYEISEIGAACKLTAGYELKGALLKRSDIDFASTKLDENNDLLITELALKSTGPLGVVVNQLKQAFNGTTVAINEGDYKNTYTNTVTIQIFNQGPDVAKMVKALGNGEFVVLLKEKSTGLYRVFGYDAGLMCSGMDNDDWSDSNPGWTVTLTETTDVPVMYFQSKDEDGADTTETSLASMIKNW